MSLVKTRMRVDEMFAWKPAWKSVQNPRGLHFWSQVEVFRRKMAQHEPLIICLLILNLLVLIATTVLATIASVENDSKAFKEHLGVNQENLDTKFHLMPAKWTFLIWIVIYFWQYAWIFYSLTMICRVNKYTDSFLYQNPSILPDKFSAVYIMNLIISIAWLFCYDNRYYVASFLALLSMAVTLYICTFFAVYLLWMHQNILPVSEMWAHIILVHNGLGIYAAWSTVATLLGFHTLLVKTFYIKSQDAATVCLAILLIIVVAYAPLEMLFSKKRLRYVITPYVTVIVALAGMIDAHNWDVSTGTSNGVLKIVIMALILLATCAKATMIVFRIFRSPTKVDSSCSGKDTF